VLRWQLRLRAAFFTDFLQILLLDLLRENVVRLLFDLQIVRELKSLQVRVIVIGGGLLFQAFSAAHFLQQIGDFDQFCFSLAVKSLERFLENLVVKREVTVQVFFVFEK
jgi:hypothetical protein